MSTFIPFNLETGGDYVTLAENLTISTWTDNRNNMNSCFTGSVGSAEEQLFTSSTSSANAYLNVYQTGSTLSEAEIQFAVAYGNRNGSGSPDFTNDTGSFGLSHSKLVYGQYRNLLHGDDSSNIRFGTHTPEDIYVINIQRARLRNNLKPGSLNLKLSGSFPPDWSPGSDGGGFTFDLTDDSVTTTGSAQMTNLGRQYNIVSGTSGIMSGSTIGQQGGTSSYGLFYPDSGIILLNPDMFTGSLRPHRNQGLSDNSDRNTERLFQAVSAAGHFIIDSEEQISSQYYFIRARNNQFNHTNNPTFVGTGGNLKFQSMINNPKTFITTVGLYNSQFDLLAVAKLSQPRAKDMTKEALIRVKLDY